MGIVSALRDFIATAPPVFALNAVVGVDYLKEETECYTIEAVPCDPVIHAYCDGSSLRRFQFTFAGKEIWGDDVIINLENIDFYGALVTWMDEQSREGKLPKLGEKDEAVSLRTISSPMLYQENGDKARYQITCELEYIRSN